jgi:hypothetical protein
LRALALRLGRMVAQPVSAHFIEFIDENGGPRRTATKEAPKEGLGRFAILRSAMIETVLSKLEQRLGALLHFVFSHCNPSSWHW